jgi:hypothetical protein
VGVVKVCSGLEKQLDQGLLPQTEGHAAGQQEQGRQATRDRLATQVAEMAVGLPRMPPIQTILIGASAGVLRDPLTDITLAPDTAPTRAIAMAIPLSPDQADTIAEVTTDRLATQSAVGLSDYMVRSYNELFPKGNVVTVVDGAAVLIELTPASDVSATILHELLMSRNLAFL